MPPSVSAEDQALLEKNKTVFPKEKKTSDVAEIILQHCHIAEDSDFPQEEVEIFRHMSQRELLLIPFFKLAAEILKHKPGVMFRENNAPLRIIICSHFLKGEHANKYGYFDGYHTIYVAVKTEKKQQMDQAATLVHELYHVVDRHIRGLTKGAYPSRVGMVEKCLEYLKGIPDIYSTKSDFERSLYHGMRNAKPDELNGEEFVTRFFEAIAQEGSKKILDYAREAKLLALAEEIVGMAGKMREIYSHLLLPKNYPLPDWCKESVANHSHKNAVHSV